jgi:hypothetical protein
MCLSTLLLRKMFQVGKVRQFNDVVFGPVMKSGKPFEFMGIIDVHNVFDNGYASYAEFKLPGDLAALGEWATEKGYTFRERAKADIPEPGKYVAQIKITYYKSSEEGVSMKVVNYQTL